MTVRSPAAFVVLSSPRSGSSWLIDLLDSHPAVVAYGELFLGADDELAYGSRDVPRFEGYLAGIPRPVRYARGCLQIAYLHRLYRRRQGVAAIGFKLMYGQVRRNRGLLTTLAARRTRALHLVRANTLSSVISYEVAHANGVFRGPSSPAFDAHPVVLDQAGLRERLEQMDRAVSRARVWLERLRFPRLEIAYEELIGRKEETLGRVLGFLGVSVAEDALVSSLARSPYGSGLDLVANADEIRAALTGTRFEWMLTEHSVAAPTAVAEAMRPGFG